MADITMYRGDSVLIDVTVIGSDGGAFDLTGSKLWMTAKTSKSQPDINAVFIKESPSSGITITSAPLGTAVVELVPADTDLLTGATTLYYDVQLKDSNSRIWTVAEGTISVLEDITRDET